MSNRTTPPAPLVDRVAALLATQRTEWPLMAENAEAVRALQTRTFDFDGFQIRAQFNPGRLTSVSAPVDPAAILARPCFLCTPNRPIEQRGLAFGSEFVILCNPFPIFHDHFTVPQVSHVPQAVLPWFGRMLELVAALGEHNVVLYNGPRCGASAPDHMHWQAGEKTFLPIVPEYGRVSQDRGLLLVDRPDLRCVVIRRYLRPVLALESPDAAGLHRAFACLMALLPHAPGEEPLLNLLATCDGDVLRLLILPRACHRPHHYSHPDPDQQLLLSPGSVDLGGVVVVPRERDFERLSHRHLEEVFREVCLSDEEVVTLAQRLASTLPEADSPASFR